MNFREVVRALIQQHRDEGWPALIHVLQEEADRLERQQQKEIEGSEENFEFDLDFNNPTA